MAETVAGAAAEEPGDLSRRAVIVLLVFDLTMVAILAGLVWWLRLWESL